MSGFCFYKLDRRVVGYQNHLESNASGCSKAFEPKKLPFILEAISSMHEGYNNTLKYVHRKKIAGPTGCYKKNQPEKRILTDMIG